MYLRYFSVISLIFIFGGCASLGEKYSDYNHEKAVDTAKVTFFRTSESKLYFARSAPVYIDEKKCFSMPIGGFTSVFLQPGNYRFMTTTFDAPSKCVINARLNAGTEYFVEVRPNTSAAMELMLMSLASSAALSASNNTYFPGFYGSEEDCKGMFIFLPKRDSDMESKMDNLKHLRIIEKC